MTRYFYLKRRKALIAYLLSKAQQEDFHAVRDACVDIEVLDAKWEGRNVTK